MRAMMEAHLNQLKSVELKPPEVNRNSALRWLPVVEQLGVNSPRTETVMYPHRSIAGWMEDGPRAENTDFEMLVTQTQSACEKIGYPCFLRTDLASAKHDGPEAYLIRSDKDIRRCLSFTIEDNELKFWTDRNGPQCMLVREFLELDAPFAAFRRLPISREWRIFADGQTIWCFHPYWPADALREHINDDCRDWEAKLADLHDAPDCLGVLSNRSMDLAGLLGGAWSVDWAMDTTGKWWLIDCATMEDSWHWPGCEIMQAIKGADNA